MKLNYIINESLTPREAMRNVVYFLQKNGYNDKEEIIDTIMRLRQQDQETYNKVKNLPNNINNSIESIEFLYKK